MKRVLIVSPHFPPVNAADMHRVRVSLPHFEAFGWKPFVLTVAPAYQEMPIEAELIESLPPGLSITRVRALPPRWTRRIGIGNLGLRAFWPLYHAGATLIAREAIDLVFFSTTVYPVMVLGRLWKHRFKTRYVLDIQDAWLSEYYDDKPRAARPPKYAWARALNAALEPFAMRRVDGLITVSPEYLATLRRRYAWITDDMGRIVPFGAAADDFDLAQRLTWRNPHFTRGDGRLHGVAVGRGGEDMRVAATILFRAVVALNRSAVGATRPVDLTFVGTDYAPAHLARKTLEPVAIAEGAGAMVTESAVRIPYFEGLRLLRDADFLILLGSDDPQYSPSKVYPYLLARRPIVAVLHASSPVLDLIRQSGAGCVVTFTGGEDIASAAAQLENTLATLVPGWPTEPDVTSRALAACSARELTHRQCEAFDAWVGSGPTAAEAACLG